MAAKLDVLEDDDSGSEEEFSFKKVKSGRRRKIREWRILIARVLCDGTMDRGCPFIFSGLPTDNGSSVL